MIPKFAIEKITESVKNIKFFQPNQDSIYGDDVELFVTIGNVAIDLTEPPTYEVPGKTSFQVQVQRALNFGEAVLYEVTDDSITFVIVFNKKDLDIPDDILEISHTDKVLRQVIADKIIRSGILTFTNPPIVSGFSSRGT